MGDVYRETRVWRERGDSPSDDEHYKSTTVRRYKVAPSRGDRYDRTVEVDDDRRSRYSGQPGRSSGDLTEMDRRSYAPDRPRSAFEPPFGGSPGPDRTTRSIYYERDVEQEPAREPRSYVYGREPERDARSRISVYETKEVERDWDSRFHPHHEDDMKIEKRVERREDGNYVVEKRYEDVLQDPHGCEVERISKETEYYTPINPPPVPQPVIIRQRAPEPQKIIVQEAPPPAPVIIPRQEPGVVVIREKEPVREVVRREPHEEEYYYRHERRDKGGHRDRDYAVERYNRRRGEYTHYSDDEDYYVRRTVVRRDRSESPHHKRHLAEGALAGAGVTALLNSRRDEYGDLPDNRGRKVLAGAALGALGTEAFRRAKSAYGDRWGDDEESPDRHSRLRTGLGIAAVALAAAGAAKYYQAGKIEKEEALRGRSRRRSRSRHSVDEYYSRSQTRTESRGSRRRSLSTAAKAALGTVATAGLVKHMRNKSKSKSRSPPGSRSRSRSRSKSRLRRGAEIAGAAAAAGVANRLWKKHKEKKEDESSYTSSDDDDYHRRRRRPSRSRSQSRSMARSIHSEHATDPELGLVEYGNDPLRTEPPPTTDRAYVSEAEERRRRRRRRRERERSRSSSASDRDRKRSKSRLRDMAAAGAAAIGIKEYKDRKDREKKEQRSREREADREHRSGGKSRDRRAYDDGVRDAQRSEDPYARPQSPPTASGGAYYPPYPTGPTPPPGAGFAAFPNPSGEFRPYVPSDYTGYPPPPPGPPPAAASGAAGGYPPPPPGPPTGGGKIPPDHVSDSSQGLPSDEHGKHEGAFGRTSGAASGDTGPGTDSRIDGVNSEDGASSQEELPHPAKSVTFIPLSPKSSRTMKMHRQQQAEAEAAKTKETEEQQSHKNDSRLTRVRDGPGSSRSGDVSRSGRHRGSRSDDSDSDCTVEFLPDRFDSRGEPLNSRAASHHRWTNRSGNFERRPKHQGDWDVRGAWQVGGTDTEAVERIVRGVTGVLEGRQNWVGLLGEVLNASLEGSGHHREIEDEDDDRERRRRLRKHRR